ncbi:MAG: family 43 glycosylhydrolase [Bacteroidaceae bacterium]|nr:family 43 glycosylhydrolase [Bacteroidaceae bacterium]
MKKKTLFLAFFLAFVASQVNAQKKYSNPVYGSDFPDPTVQRALDGTFYAYATGCKCKKSTDLVNWTNVSGVISRPTWNDSIHADGTKDSYSLWAADVNYVDGKYICYYASALWGNGSRTGIGVAVGDTPTKFTDRGKLFRSTEIGVKNSIDPCYVEEFDKKYLVWGSFNDICLVELTDDALAVKNFSPINNPQPDGSWKRHAGVTKIAGGAFEGAMIFKRGKYYYLFASVGSCCEGENSTYRTVVGRATKLTGPYTNKQGGQMTSNNYTTIISGDSRWKGPGHNSEIITDDEGQTWLLYHSYDMNNGCNGRLMLLDKITWKNDWPVINDGHPSNGEMDAPIFYSGNGANITYKMVNADLMKSNWKGWTVESDSCELKSGNGSAFMPFGYAQYGGTFDISQTISTNTADGLYEMKLNGFDTEHNVEYYVGKVTSPVPCPADNGTTAPTSAAVISNNFLSGRYSQSVYALVVGGKMTFGMRTKQPLSATERFCVSNVNIINRGRLADADPTALASVLESYYAMADEVANGGQPYYAGYNATIAYYKDLAIGTQDVQTQYQQLLKIHRTLDSIQTSIDAYAGLVVEVAALQDKIATAQAGGYCTQEALDALAEGQQVLTDCNLKDKEVKALITRLQAVGKDMMYSYQTGDGSEGNPYVILRPEQLDHMHDVLIQDQMVYFVLAADVDMAGFEWEQLNTSTNGYRYWINFDGQGHIIRNLTPNGTKYYPSFFGTMCGEIRNTGFVDAKVEGTASGAAVIGGTLGHSTFKDAEGNLFPVIIENCYMTGSITSKGYVGAIGGTLGNSPVTIRNCYSAVAITGNGSAANYSGGLVGRVRTNLTMEKCYAAAPVSSPIAGGIMAGGQNRDTPGSVYDNVIAWNPSVEGNTSTATAAPFGFFTDLDVFVNTYVFADMLLNGEHVPEGLSHTELCDIAGRWGSPWYYNPTAGNGYPILQWQHDRGDHRQICGFNPEDDPTGIESSRPSFGGETGVWYDLSGRRVSAEANSSFFTPSSSLKKGIYIINGRKVIR